MTKDRRTRGSEDPIIGDNGLSLRQEEAHPCVDLLLSGLTKGTGEELLFSATATQHLQAYLAELAGTPQFGESLKSLALFAYMLDRRGSPAAAKAILDIAEGVSKAAKGK